MNTVSEQIIAQCTLCNHKQELTAKPEDPRSVKCSECGGHTTQYVSRILSPEELAKYGPVNSSPNKRSVFSLPNNPKSKENDLMAKYPHITKEFLEAEFAAGKSGIQVEREQGMPSGVISYYMKKFGVKSQFKPVAKKNTVAPTKPETSLPVENNLDTDADARAKDNETAARIIEAEVELNREKDLEIERLNLALKGVTDQAGARIGELEKKLEDAYAVQLVPNHSSSTRDITVKTAGSQADVEDELTAILSYVKAMHGRDFKLEIYLGEVDANG